MVVAECTVVYEGRLTSRLDRAIRLLMVKADGCVAIHADGGAYKPLNWMNAPNTLIENEAGWRVSNQNGEALSIELHEVHSDVTVDLGSDPGLQKDGVERHLQELLAEQPHELEDGLRLVRREYPTDIGPVDLLCRDAEGRTVAVEIKRRGEIDGIEQLARYVEFLSAQPDLAPVRAVFAAQLIKPQARMLAATRAIECVEVDYDRLRGVERPQQRLF